MLRREKPRPSLGFGGFVVSGCLLRCFPAEAKPVAEVHDSGRVAHVLEVRADLDCPLSLMLRQRHPPAVLDGLDHRPLNGVITAPHAVTRLPRSRLISKTGL